MKIKSEKLLLDVDDEDADTDREKADLPFDDMTQQILLKDNISASVIAPEQEDFNKTGAGGASLKMGSREMGEIELVD